jgi:hypothetical protein
MAMVASNPRHLAGLPGTPASAADGAGGLRSLGVVSPIRSGRPIPIDFEMARSGGARLEIYAVDGGRVRTLFEGPVAAGRVALTWDGRGRDGSKVAAGVYFFALTAGEARLTRRIVLLP